MYLFISTPEVFVVILVVVLVFGADKVPEIARGLGKGMRQLRDATNDIKQEITKSAENNGIDTSIADDIKNEIEGVKDDIEDMTGPIQRRR